MNEINILNKSDYPNTLKNMPGSPRKLYIRGHFPVDEDRKYLCVVGSRDWTTYGRDSVNKILSGLRGYPISIVSGLALGIDSIAHMAALDAGLHCIAFPGSTLEWKAIYPPAHTRLAREIVDKGGALVSQWRVGYDTGKWAFPARNKLMAGLSHATLIVEAGKGSGSLMTAKHAEEYDRDIMAIPGPISNSHSYGPHMLIKNGALMVSSARDVLENFGFEANKLSSETLSIVEKLDQDSRSIIEVLKISEYTIDHLSEKLRMSPTKLNEKLAYLELEGLVSISDDTVRCI